LWESRDYGASWNRLPPVVATGAETGIDGTTITDLVSYAPADEPASEALVIATANVAIGTYLGALTAPGIEWSSILITAVFSASLFAAAGSVVLVGEQRFEHGSGRAFAWSLRLSGTLWMLMVVLIAGVAVLQGTRQPAVVPSVLSVGVVLYATGRRNRHRRVTHDESVVLAAVPSPALILGTGGEVIAANPRARRLLSLNGDLSHLPVSAEEGAIRVSLTGLGGEESQATCRPLPDQCGAPSGRYLCVFEPPDGAVDDAGAASDRLENYELTDRERDIVGFLIRGRTYREIGDALYISEATVRSHAHNVYRKTDTSNRAELISLFSHDPRVGRDR
jgi:DNA-binding CsgD family transcriptional regulator